MVSGPRMQFSPTTSAPACSAIRHACAGSATSRSVPSRCTAKVIDRGQAGRLDRLEGEQRLAGPAERLGDDEVHAGLGGPADLLLERGPGRPLAGAARLVHVRVAQVARQHRAGFRGDPLGDGQRVPVQRLEQVLLADDPQLLPVPVVGEGLDHVRARVHELAVQPLDDLRVLQHDLGDERPGLQVTPPLALEKVAFGAHDRALPQGLEQIRHANLHGSSRPAGTRSRRDRPAGTSPRSISCRLAAPHDGKAADGPGHPGPAGSGQLPGG